MVTEEKAHKTILVEGLSETSNNARVAFAAACAERVLPFYGAYRKKTGKTQTTALRRLVDPVWAHLLGEKLNAEQIRTAMVRCSKLFPPDDDGSFERNCAESAVVAVLYTLGTLECGERAQAGWERPYERQGGAEEAACAAGRVDEAIGFFVRDRAARPPHFRPELEHPAFSAEHARQLRDLGELREHPRGSSALYTHLRARAEREHDDLFTPQWSDEAQR